MGMAAADLQFHVLAVDDSLIDRKLIERLFRISSCQVTTVDSGSKALEFLGLQEEHDNQNQPCVSPSNQQEVEVNLIITDYCMPGMTGYDLLKKIKVQNLIERCLQLYMNQQEVVRTLLHQAKIEPGFTELVWQKLEEENQEFFRAYHLRLMVKDQIERFNDLLERQVKAMQMFPTQSIPVSNGSQIRQIPPNSTCQARDHAGPNVKPENVHQTVNANLSNIYTNGASSLQPCMQTAIDVSDHARRIDASSNMLLAQSSNLGMVQGVRGGVIKSEAGYSGNLPFLYGPETNILEAHPGITDPSVSSFSSVESDSQPVNETVLDADTSSFGFLGQIPRNFSLSDLTADFSNSSDILESYSGSAFLATDVNNFLDPQDRREHQGPMAPGLQRFCK